MSQKYRVDQDLCIQCGACPPECPVAAITPDAPFVIDPEVCNACGACVAVCPVEAISTYEYNPPEPPAPATGNAGMGIGMGIRQD